MSQINDKKVIDNNDVFLLSLQSIGYNKKKNVIIYIYICILDHTHILDSRQKKAFDDLYKDILYSNV